MLAVVHTNTANNSIQVTSNNRNSLKIYQKVVSFSLFQSLVLLFNAPDAAWNYLMQVSGYDLKSMLIEIAERRVK